MDLFERLVVAVEKIATPKVTLVNELFDELLRDEELLQADLKPEED